MRWVARTGLIGHHASMLVLDDISKAFGSTVAVDGLSLTIEPGEIFGLLRPNGAGKTTTVDGGAMASASGRYPCRGSCCLGRVAQLARALALHARGPGFKSRPAYWSEGSPGTSVVGSLVLRSSRPL